MAITDLTGTVWRLEQGVVTDPIQGDDRWGELFCNIYTVNGYESKSPFLNTKKIDVFSTDGVWGLEFEQGTGSNLNSTFWNNTRNRWETNRGMGTYYVSSPIVVEITDGEKATDERLIYWFTNNAIQIVDPPQDWLYKFLNDSGLTRVFQKLKTVLDKKADTSAVPFVATYEQTTYADVTAAIDADRAIVVNFANNKNLICVTYATYVVGQNVTMSGIYKYGSGVSLAEITLTPENAWSIAHTWMQERLESGANIKTVNNQSLLGSGNIDVGGGDGNVFIARYQSTSFTDLISACKSGKVICVQYTTNAEANPCGVLVRTETLIKLVYYRSITSSGDENPGNRVYAVQYSVSSDNTLTLNNYALPNAALGTSKTPSGDNLRISDASTLSGGEVRRFLNFNKKSGDDYVKVTAQDTATYEQIISWEALLAQTSYVDGVTGDLSTLTTDNKTNLVSAINEVYEKSGEPFRVKNWANNALDVTIVPCTSDAGNTSLAKMVYTINDVEGADYQIVGMIAYEVFDAASGGNRINCWPVCQFTGNGQKELSVRWMCGGTTNKVAKRINAWVLLKHR